jgi:flagellar hook-associated protein FlgK
MAKGKEFLMSLNPRYKEEEEQKQDIANLKGQMGDVVNTMNTMMSMMQDLNKKISGTSPKGK